jgi:hypothetical protein
VRSPLTTLCYRSIRVFSIGVCAARALATSRDGKPIIGDLNEPKIYRDSTGPKRFLHLPPYTSCLTIGTAPLAVIRRR